MRLARLGNLIDMDKLCQRAHLRAASLYDSMKAKDQVLINGLRLMVSMDRMV